MRILVVEDERRMAGLLRQGLCEEGHTVVVATNGREGYELAAAGPFDLLLLDVMLPGLTGLEIVRRLRTMQNQTPILMLTARDATEDIVLGLNLGADDYLTKPFSFEVLFARVRAVARRGPVAQPVVIQVAGLVLDVGARQVRRDGREITLTRTEFALLELLARNVGRVVPRETLIETIWGNDSDVESNTLDVFIRLLRAKIERAGAPKLLQTVRGVGYCLRREQC